MKAIEIIETDARTHARTHETSINPISRKLNNPAKRRTKTIHSFEKFYLRFAASKRDTKPTISSKAVQGQNNSLRMNIGTGNRKAADTK